MIPKQISDPIKITYNIQDDDFICFMKSDGSTLVSSKGVVVIGKKIESDS